VRRPALLIVVAASVSAFLAWVGHVLPGGAMWDATQLWLATRALVAGLDPYQVVQGRLPYPLFYPLPAVLVFAPLALLPLEVARLAWAALQGGVMAFAGLRVPVLLVAMLSGAYVDALMLGQWSPFLTAAAVLPALGFVWAAKPSIGLAMFVGFPSRIAFIGGVTLVALSLLLLPTWPQAWLHAVRSQIYLPPVLRPGGFLLLLAFLRWRDPAGRLLGTLSLIPQSCALYETLPLFLCCRDKRQAYALAILTYVTAFLSQWMYPWDRTTQLLEANLGQRWGVVLPLVYLPVLGLVLWPFRHRVLAVRLAWRRPA
jgi:hypothetical protein